MGRRTNYFLLMHDSKGWCPISLSRPGIDHLRRTHQLPEPDVFVPRGTLVKIDPTFDYSDQASVVVCSIDHQSVKLTILVKELLPIEEATCDILFPMTPRKRYEVMTDQTRHPILTAQVGDTVFYSPTKDWINADVGMIQYVGPVKEVGDGTWFGVELLDSNRGNSDGSVGHCRYFSAPPRSSVFVTADFIRPYEGPLVDIDNNLQTKMSVNCEPPRPKVNNVKANNNFGEPRLPNIANNRLSDRIFNHISNDDFRASRSTGHSGGDESYKNKQAANKYYYGCPSAPSQRSPDQTLRNSGREAVRGALNYQPEVEVGSRVVWLADNGPEFGVVRWIGHSPDVDERGWIAGVEFDNPIGHGQGRHRGTQLFHAKENHASLVPLDGLMLASDFGDRRSVSPRVNGHSPGLPPVAPPRRYRAGSSDDSSYPAIRPRGGSPEESDVSLPSHLKGSSLSSSSESYESSHRSTRSSHLSPTYEMPETHRYHKNEPSQYPENYRHKSEPPPALQNQLYEDVGGASLNNGAVDFPEYAVVQKGPRKQRSPPKSPSPPPKQRTPTPVFDLAKDPDPNGIDIGSLVELHVDQVPHYGVVKWIGWLDGKDMKQAGIELEDELPGAHNGWYQGSEIFECPQSKGVFVDFDRFQVDQRFAAAVASNANQHQMTEQDFGEMDCPIVQGFYPPVRVEEMSKISGINKGVQGHQNSCYLDATLFSMFTFTSVFDCLLYRPQRPDDIAEYSEVQRVLREEIVNPLRKTMFVRADRVMKLRELLDHLSSVRGLLSEEKDPEEFLNSLLCQTLNASPFLELSSGQTAHTYQLFVERDETKKLPTVQELVEQSFLTSNVKLKKVPPVLILQMPRFGKQFKVYDRIVPSQLLDVTDIIEDSPRQCIVCGRLAVFECAECFGQHGSGMDSTAFCAVCLQRAHQHQKRQSHSPVRLKVPEEFPDHNMTECNPRLFMELFAVVCIETSHYVSFVKCGVGPDAPWCFFDSMADRKGEQHGYNIPEVTSAPDVRKWLTEEGMDFLKSIRDDKMLPDYARRLICDGYMCLYQSPDVMMYQ